MVSLLEFFNKEKLLRSKGKKIISSTLTSPHFPPPINTSTLLKLLPNSFDYSPAGGNFQLRTILASFYSKQVQHQLNKENIFCGAGGKEVIYILYQTLLKKGDEVIVYSPYWSTHLKSAQLAGAKIKIINSEVKNQFAFDFNKIKNNISPKTKIIVLNSPCVSIHLSPVRA